MQVSGIKELTMNEIEQVNGGNPIAVAVIAAVGVVAAAWANQVGQNGPSGAPSTKVQMALQLVEAGKS
ncbi:class IIb bacteriocin, lactobin A/cerein 7B family [Shewanella abyssi]|uniref:class IIb bacteriocin, lactobin A/cerein 7B family n=1 Tax=Shewanella abyssi TaxID=311789 RepID=UPI00200C0110|nr:class IIb bacteriocin, lactobin A/cerein 7B family [Shewanella abyssi]MCL1050334.1 class IIb bacteriocin, lactobin A/cerein 7B family [Shewanella abyssi]